MKLNPYLSIILAATIGGFAGVFLKLINLPPSTMTAFRAIVPIIILSTYFIIKKENIFAGNYRWMIIASSLNAARMFLYVFAYLYTSVANAVIILFTWPIFGTIFGMIFLKEKVTKKTFSLILLSFLGLIIMQLNKEIGFQNKDFIGMIAMLFSAILFSLSMIIFKNELKTYTNTQTIFFQNLIGAIIFLPFIFINEPFPTLIETNLLIIYGFIVGIIVFFLFFNSLKQIKMSHYSLLTYWEVVSAIIFGIIFFNEEITWNILIGGSLIVISGLLLRKR